MIEDLRDLRFGMLLVCYALSITQRIHTLSNKTREQGAAAANREDWVELWATVIGAIFLHSYLKETKATQLVPSDRTALSIILDAYLLEKSIYELSYELNNRPDWVAIPIKGIKSILRSSRPDQALTQTTTSPKLNQ